MIARRRWTARRAGPSSGRPDVSSSSKARSPSGSGAVGPDDGHGVDPVERVAHPRQPVEVVGVPERGRGHQDPHPGAAQDVADLLRSVEVDDGDHHRPQEGGGVEGRRRPPTQLGSWNATGSPGPTPRSASAPASRRARSPQLPERPRPRPQSASGSGTPGRRGRPAPRRAGARGSGRPTARSASQRRSSSGGTVRSDHRRRAARAHGLGGQAHGGWTARASRTSMATVREGTGGRSGEPATARQRGDVGLEVGHVLPPLDEAHPAGVVGVGGERVVEAPGLGPGGGDLRVPSRPGTARGRGVDLDDPEHDDHDDSLPRSAVSGPTGSAPHRRLR